MTSKNVQIIEQSTEHSRKLSAPRFRIKVAGKFLDTDIATLVKDISLSENIEKMPKLQINLVNDVVRLSNYGLARVRLSDTNVFTRYTDIDLWIGFSDAMTYMGRYKITRIKPSFSESEMRFQVTAYGLEWTLARSRSLGALRFADEGEKIYSATAVKDIFRYYTDYTWNFRGIHEPNPRVGDEKWFIFKESDKTDLEFLYRIARRDGWRFWIQSEEINFGGLYRIEHVINYEPIARSSVVKHHFWYDSGNKSDLIDFSAEIHEKEKGNKLVFVGWDKEKGRPLVFNVEVVRKGDEFVVQRNPDNPEIDKVKVWTSGDLVPLGELIHKGGRLRIEAMENIRDEATLKAYAIKIWKKMKSEWITATGTVFGTPVLRAGDLIHIHNAGLRYSGVYYVFSAGHKLAKNQIYTSSFKARMLLDFEA